MDGWVNLLLRFYYYVQEGMQQLNGLRTIGYALIGLAGVFAVAQSGKYWILVLIGLASIPSLGLLGWLWVTRGKKSIEYYQVRYTSTYGRYQIEMQEKQIEQQAKIIELLERIAK